MNFNRHRTVSDIAGRCAIRAAYVGAAVLVTSCASDRHAQTRIQSTLSAPEPPRVQRLFIHANMKTPTFTDKIYGGFVSGLKSELGRCGVQVESFHFDPAELDPGKKATDSMRQFRPDSILSIVRTQSSAVVGQGGANVQYYFRFVMSEAGTRKELWKAVLDVKALTQNMFVDDAASGAKIAASVVQQMKGDRLLTNCA